MNKSNLTVQQLNHLITKAAPELYGKIKAIRHLSRGCIAITYSEHDGAIDIMTEARGDRIAYIYSDLSGQTFARRVIEG